jgi:hypothetical protein
MEFNFFESEEVQNLSLLFWRILMNRQKLRNKFSRQLEQLNVI